MKFPYTTTHTETGRKKVVKYSMYKIIEENIGSNLYDIGQSNLSHDTSPKAREKKDKMNLWDFIKVKSFCTAKETVIKTKRHLTD